MVDDKELHAVRSRWWAKNGKHGHPFIHIVWGVGGGKGGRERGKERGERGVRGREKERGCKVGEREEEGKREKEWGGEREREGSGERHLIQDLCVKNHWPRKTDGQSTD